MLFGNFKRLGQGRWILGKVGGEGDAGSGVGEELRGVVRFWGAASG